jgi:hypothetical protein
MSERSGYTLYLSDDLRERVSVWADNSKRSQADIIDVALEDFFDSHRIDENGNIVREDATADESGVSGSEGLEQVIENQEEILSRLTPSPTFEESAQNKKSGSIEFGESRGGEDAATEEARLVRPADYDPDGENVTLSTGEIERLVAADGVDQINPDHIRTDAIPGDADAKKHLVEMTARYRWDCVDEDTLLDHAQELLDNDTGWHVRNNYVEPVLDRYYEHPVEEDVFVTTDEMLEKLADRAEKRRSTELEQWAERGMMAALGDSRAYKHYTGLDAESLRKDWNGVEGKLTEEEIISGFLADVIRGSLYHQERMREKSVHQKEFLRKMQDECPSTAEELAEWYVNEEGLDDAAVDTLVEEIGEWYSGERPEITVPEESTDSEEMGGMTRLSKGEPSEGEE